MMTVKVSRNQETSVHWGMSLDHLRNRVVQIVADGQEGEILLEAWNKLNGPPQTVGEIMTNLIQMDPNKKMRMFWIEIED